MKTTAKQIRKILKELGDPETAEHSKRFFKTGKGEYGEGDRFLGIRVPELRKQAKAHRGMGLTEVLKSLRSPFHEERLFAVLMLVDAFKRGDEATRTNVYAHYLSQTRYINNWDLVDSSAHLIVGAQLDDKDKKPLYDLARSDDLWERRIAIIATFHMIKQNDFKDALDIAAILLQDEQDLIHKAVGWMLREVGNRDPRTERTFLKKHYRKMPRTMLRYAIEKFPEKERKSYLHGTV